MVLPYEIGQTGYELRILNDECRASSFSARTQFQ